MSYATVMVHLDVGASADAQLKIAAEQARRFGARLIGIAAAEPILRVYVGAPVPAALRFADEEETEEFGEILKHLVTERGLGILIVEHDMALVMAVCQYLYVLDFGHLIFEGTPAEVQASELVRAAYLGSEAVEVAVQ